MLCAPSRLSSVRADAFISLNSLRHSLYIKLSGSLLEDLPPGLLAPLASVTQLSVDLRGNRLTSLSPVDLFGNASNWEHMGTKLIAGEFV